MANLELLGTSRFRELKPLEVRARLTERQREVVRLIASGKSSKEVAAVMGISTKTAESHRAQIMARLDLHSVQALVHYAIREKIIKVLDLKGVK